MTCDCVQTVDEQLKPHGIRLSGGITMSGKFVLALATERLDGNKRKRAAPMFCTFCPFCGKKLNDEQRKEE